MTTPPATGRAPGRGGGAGGRPHVSQLVKERLIGNGADGKVFLMRDAQGNPYAVKEMILADNQLQRAEGVKKQIEALQRLPDHPNVIRHFGAHLGTCSLHILMEFVPGGSISALLGNLGAFSEAVVRDYARQLCRGLAFLHEQGVVHRDIKGANCLVNADGRLQIADFGSSVIGDPKEHKSRGLQGTAHWMSPESIREEVSPKGDVWALACTVIEMATARSPWADARFTNDWAAMFHISQCGRGPPIPPHLSRQAHAFLRACFEIDANARPSAEECLAMPFLADEFDPDSGDAAMLPPNADELTPHGELPRRDDSPLGTDYASTFSSVSFAPIDPEWGDAEQPDLATGGDASADTTDAEAAATAEAHMDEASVSLESRVQAVVTHADIMRCVKAAAEGKSVTPVPTSAVQSIVPGRTLARLEEAELFNILTFLPVQALGRASLVSQQLHQLIDCDSKERLWRRLFVAVFGPVDDVRAALRKSWKLAYRTSMPASSWVASSGRYRVRRRLAHSAAVFEGVDLQGGAVGSNEAVPCIVKVEALPRPKSRAASTPTKRAAAHQSPVRVSTANRTLPNQSPNKLPATLPSLHHNPTVPAPADDPKARLPPTQGGRFTFIRPNGTPINGATPAMPTGLPPAGPPSRQGVAGTRPEPGGTAFNPHPPSEPPSGVMSRVASKNDIHGPGEHGNAAAATAAAPVNTSGGSNTSSSGVPGPGTLPTPLVATQLNGTLTSASGLPSARSDAWNDLYEYQRSEPTPLHAPKPVRSLAHHQYRILRHLDAMGVQCIPRPLYLNTDGTDISGHSVLVTSALGPSLSELLLFSGNQLSMRTVMTLALRLLMALADMHDRDVVHGGITPSNIVMGRGPQRGQVHFVNFSHARFYRDPKTHRAANNVVGTAHQAKRSYEYYCFCSTSVQRGCTPSPRDDVISVGYVLCYLSFGGLPWSADGTQLDGTKLVRAKTQYLEQLSTTPPLQLYAFLKSAYALRQGDTPDYVFLCNLVRRMLRERGWNPDAELDWESRAVF